MRQLYRDCFLNLCRCDSKITKQRSLHALNHSLYLMLYTRRAVVAADGEGVLQGMYRFEIRI